MPDGPDLLPHPLDEATYWREHHPRALDPWRPALDALNERHGLAARAWRRFRLGKNLVFEAVDGDVVVKLVPPLPWWRENAEREAQALRWIHGRLPVPTPRLVAAGELSGWSSLVLERLPGEPLYSFWPQLGAAERLRLAEANGELLAALRALPTRDAPPVLRHDWRGMLAEQAAEAPGEFARGGVPAALVETWAAFLAARPLDLTGDVLLQGDLWGINLLAEPRGGRVEPVGLVDWGDVKLGPWAHELISPGFHAYGGGPEAAAFWRGAGLAGRPDAEALAFELTARTALFYPDAFGARLARTPGLADAPSWEDLARRWWGLGGPSS